MRTTILFGGSNKERLVSVASAQALNAALPEAELWFWDADDVVYATKPEALQAHAEQFSLDKFTTGMQAIINEELLIRKADRARSQRPVAAIQRGLETQLPVLVAKPHSTTLQ